MACGILHNICKLWNIEIDEKEQKDIEGGGDGGDEVQPRDGRAAVVDGAAVREQLARAVFGKLIVTLLWYIGKELSACCQVSISTVIQI